MSANSVEYKSFTSKYDFLSNVLISDIYISPSITIDKSAVIIPGSLGAKQYRGIWDTGATNTVVTKRVINECELKQIGITHVKTVGGARDSGVYLASVLLPNRLMIESLQVTEGEIGEVDVLIGMDIIGLGDFAVSNYQGKTTFTFRWPSRQEIDFNPPGENPLL